MNASVVSVVIAVKNAESYLRQCLDSVVAQTYPHGELIVVNGQSTDATEEIAKSYQRVCFLEQTGNGFADAWNCGIRAAQGAYVAFLDSDDFYTPRKLEWQVAMHDADPSLLCSIGKVRMFVEPGETPPRGFRPKVLGVDHVANMPGTLMVRRDAFDTIGIFGTEWRIASDIDWFLKLRDSGIRVGIVDELLLHKRVHGKNLSYVTASDPVYPKELLKLLQTSIARKRSGLLK